MEKPRTVRGFTCESLLGCTPAAEARAVGAGQAQADIAKSQPRFQSPGMEAGH